MQDGNAKLAVFVDIGVEEGTNEFEVWHRWIWRLHGKEMNAYLEVYMDNLLESS